jgi:hypothetical protein
MMQNFSDGLAEMAPDGLRTFLRSLIARVELDGETGYCRIVYRLPAQPGKLMASPRGFEPLFAP